MHDAVSAALAHPDTSYLQGVSASGGDVYRARTLLYLGDAALAWRVEPELPDVLAPLRLHYLRWVLFDVGSGLHFQYQGIFAGTYILGKSTKTTYVQVPEYLIAWLKLPDVPANRFHPPGQAVEAFPGGAVGDDEGVAVRRRLRPATLGP